MTSEIRKWALIMVHEITATVLVQSLIYDLGDSIQVFHENEIQPLHPFFSLHCEKTRKLQLLEAYLEPCQRSMMELFCENSSRNSTVNYFHKQAPSYIFDRVLNTSPITVGLTKNQIEKQQSSFQEHWLLFRVGLAILKLIYGAFSGMLKSFQAT